jgi:hypothetical protein
MGNLGKPPSVGWWPVGHHKVRWWNGSYWSWVALDTDKPHIAQYYALKKDEWVGDDEIEWMDRPDNWPKRSKT